MRAREFITPVEQELDEGWKDTLGSLAVAGGVALGGAGGMAAKQALTSPSGASADTTPVVKQVQAPKAELPKLTAKQNSNPQKGWQSLSNSPHENILAKTAMRAGIKGTELAAFLAQCAHETMDFKFMKEIGNSKTFKKYDPRHAPKKAKALGNKVAGDGAKYKGRGYIQLTGRHNYKVAGEALGLPLEKNPELVEKPEVAAKVAVWFWQHRVQPNVDNFNDVRAVTKPINPGLKGLQNRLETFKDYKQVVASL